jgi:GH43 family beta-xylosidase
MKFSHSPLAHRRFNPFALLWTICALSVMGAMGAQSQERPQIAPRLAPQMAPGLAPAESLAPRTFTNPVLISGADPWVTRQNGDFYYCGAGAGGIFVGKSRELLAIGSYTKVVFTPPKDQPYSKNLWAPELHFVDGKWFIYFAGDDGKNANHRMYVLRSKTGDAQGEYEFMGQLDTGGQWAIDGTLLSWQNRLYFIWSGWESAENSAQNLYIAPMSNPWTVSGPRVLLAKPELPWEIHDRARIAEGPTALVRGNRLFLLYAASASWTNDYCEGRLDFVGGDVLNPQNWRKFPQAVFSGTDQVWGPGHASFVNDGGRDWIVYHAARYSGAGWTRNIRMQPFTWKPDGTPDFGVPLAPGVPIIQ